MLHRDLLPLIFEKWNFWEAHDLKSLILERLKIALAKTETPLLPLLLTNFTFNRIRTTDQLDTDYMELKNATEELTKTAEKLHKAANNLIKNRFYEKVFMDYWDDPTQFEKFLKVLAEDADLHAFVDS